MRKIFILLLTLFTGISSAQESNYPEKWKLIDSLEVKGLVQSAQELTSEILAEAKQYGHYPDLIKAKIYHYKLYQVNHENSNQYILEDINRTIADLPAPYKNVLQSYKAGMLEQYFQDNRWRGRSRSEIDDPDAGSIETWSLKTIQDSISSTYEKSLAQEQVLIATPAGEIEELLVSQQLNRKYKPTLFDVLAHRALDFYANSSNFAAVNAADSYSFNSPLLYADTPEFADISFPEVASVTPGLKLLQTYQQLETLHAEENNSLAKIFAQLDRLEYVNSRYTGNDKWMNYNNRLDELSAEHEGAPASALILFARAMNFYDRSKETNEDGELLHPDYLTKALALAETITEEFPDSDAAQKAYQLISNITSPNLQSTIPAIITPGEHGRMYLEYNSLDTLQMKIYRVPEDFPSNLNYRTRDSVIKAYSEKEALLEREILLPQAEDHNTHSTEVVIPPQEIGTYLVFVSGEDKSEGYSHGFFQVTGLTLTRTEYDSYSIYQSLDRRTGEIIPRVKVEFYYQDSSPTQTHTDENGELKRQKPANSYRHRNSGIRVTSAGDTLSAHYWPGYYYDGEEEEDYPLARTMLYLDRAIYRPGQKVYFKGVLLQYIKDKTTTVPNEYVEVFIDDPNGEKIATFRLKTNKYGSFTGEFDLPASGITGEFEIYAKEDLEEDSRFWDRVYGDGEYRYSGLSFQVEEYKRPTFELKFDPVEETFRPGDTALVSGEAATFMGSGVNNAELVYVVTREKLVKRWWHYTYTDLTPVVTDTISTDAEGNFTISFPALADEEDLQQDDLIYRYTIHASLTDVGGETREATTSLKVGNKNLLTTITIAETVTSGDSLHLSVENTNLNEQPVPVTGSLQIYKLQGPGRILRERMWEAPEIHLIPEEEFIKLFPEEPYNSSLAPEEWPKGELVYEVDFENDGTFETEIPVTRDWESGKYLVETSSRNGNNTASAKRSFEVVNPQDLYLPDHQRFSYSLQNSDFAEDNRIELLLQSAYKELHLEVTAYDGYDRIFRQRLRLNGRETVSIPLNELEAEELEIHINGIKNNALIAETRRIQLPQVKKFLSIETETFRNKIQPGTEETWSFTVKDEENSIPDAEILASMYDASLDQFITEDWNTTSGFNVNYSSYPSFSNSNIGNVHQLNSNFPHKRMYKPGKQTFDRLQLFGFYYSRPDHVLYKRYLANRKAAGEPSQLTGNTRGRITDEDGNPLPGVNVMVKGKTNGTTSNFDGEFALDAKAGDVLVFSYLGFFTHEQVIGKNKEVYTVLEEDSSALEEVVVVGYGTEEKRSVVGAVQTANTELLQGRVAGVMVTQDDSGEMIRIRGASSVSGGASPLFIVDGKPTSKHDLRTEDILSMEMLEGAEATALYGAEAANGVVVITTRQGMNELQNVQARKDLNETAFFFPQLQLDSNGKLKFSFTSPEALTQWKFRLLAHTEDWTTGQLERSLVTQKELSLTPNPPRFLREGDTITLKSRVSNLSDDRLSGTAILQLFDAVTMEPVDMELGNSESSRNFSIEASNTAAVSWQLTIPEGVPAVTYRILARAGDFSDGEENLLPVLSNRMLVTESLPMFVRAGQTKSYDFENLRKNNSETLEHHKFSLEYSSNPAWYAIQSLPYLMEFEHECSEQTFARLYANSIAAHIMNSQPKIKEVFEAWQENGALLSDLEKNEELKSLILSETPWVRDAESETERKQRLADLFDLGKLASEKEELVRRLGMMQKSSGAWPWFSGGRDNEFITRHIVGGLGHLKQLGIEVNDAEMIRNAVNYLDGELVRDEARSRENSSDPEAFYRRTMHLHYLYVRSFYLDEHPLPANVAKITNKILEANKEDWQQRNLYDKGLLSLVFLKMQEEETAQDILASLEESAVRSEEYGMYWKDNKSGWFWYRAPIETQALLIEAFTELGGEEETVEEMKIWLLQNKRTNHWPTTKATTEATYALLMQGEDWLQVSDDTSIELGGEPLDPEKLASTEKEAGTGYLKLNWKAPEIDNSFSSIEVENKNSTSGYGGVYWQYFEDLDKIGTHSESPLNVEKELYLNVSDRNGSSLKRISPETPLKIGDLVTVRLVVRSNADMDFIHLKDMRASGFEPTNVLSGYKYQDNTAYYESTRDAATHFFFDSLNKGTYVLEYTVRANNAGHFSNGITNIESMYAPEFSGHTKGIRVNIGE